MNEKVIWFSIVSSIVLLSGVTGITIYQDVFAGTEKVEVCHKGKTITVAAEAVPAHQKHGDTVGACGGSGGGPDTLIVCNCADGPTPICVTSTFTCTPEFEDLFCSNIGCNDAGGRAGDTVSCTALSC